MSDHKFKVGDKVIRTQDNGALAVGTVCTVERVSNAGGFIDVGTGTGWYDVHNFEHYVEREAVLTPLKVFECILAGTPLEYRIKASEHGTWYSVTCADYINPTSTVLCDFRVKPQTVKVNGVDVPAPVDTVALGYPDKVYGINLGRNLVYDTTGHTKKGYFWSTEEDAQAVLDAILTSFSK